MKIILFILKKLPEELAHSLALSGLSILYKLKILPLFINKIEHEEFIFLGMSFKNKLGTAAGLDKNGDYINSLGSLGFGFLEVGTVTPLPQSGNEKPRLFRIFDEKAIINRMGFNNKGVDHLVNNLNNINYDGVIGVNIGANKASEGQGRIDDYLFCFKKVYKLADYIVINISSPNTPSLRELHNEDNLSELLWQIATLSRELKNTKPIFLKVSPDESDTAIERIVNEVKRFNFSGLISTNTTVDKKLLKNSKYHDYDGGLSGAPLFIKSNDTIKKIRSVDKKLPLIGVGGVISKKDFSNKLDCGANLVQIYTGFIIKGPSIVSEILEK